MAETTDDISSRDSSRISTQPEKFREDPQAERFEKREQTAREIFDFDENTTLSGKRINLRIAKDDCLPSPSLMREQVRKLTCRYTQA